ncbi:hypothetical protein FF011L_48970 [Roseimaritima multifibrata]|uniref:Uncharacterized protein n=1 Tax=Roseimaritima multifibrata TaxID=1930274 RepID=A0A517MMI8_9BACT|nr:hypothetical protein FF011L_48970 [Roseimaritima multifibrata]
MQHDGDSVKAWHGHRIKIQVKYSQVGCLGRADAH